jgi:Outer membrane protein beta-barrel domain
MRRLPLLFASFLLLVAAFLVLAVPVVAHAANVVTGVDGMTSTILQEKQSSFSGLGLRAVVHPDRLIKQVELLPTLEFWRNSNTLSPYGIETMRKDATLAFDARYRFNPSGWQPYVGAGYAIHFLSTRVNAPSLGLNNASDSVIKGGLSALAGLTFGLSQRLDNFIEVKYHHVPDYRQLKINWGLSYRLQ